MTFVGYLIEEQMRTRQAEIARNAARFGDRQAARQSRAERREAASNRSTLVRGDRTAPVPCARAADVAGAC
jgi:hypothetical protein